MTLTTRNSISTSRGGQGKSTKFAHSQSLKGTPLKLSHKSNTKSQDFSSGSASSKIKKTGAAASKIARKRAKAKLQKALVQRVDSQDEEKMIREQARLLRRASAILAEEGLGLPAVLDAATSADMLPQAPSAPALPHGSSGIRYGNGTRLSDTVAVLEVDPTDPLRRVDRWIPAIGARRRVGRIPAGVPFIIWAAYTNLDDYVYRKSLSDTEAAALPMEEEFWSFYESSGGDAPSLPHGFVWDEKRNLIDRRPLEE